MADNSFGTLFNVTSFGESHGSAIGCVVDGVPPNLPLSEALIQPYLDRRRPGTSKFVTQRQEDDQVEILSGIFEGKTTGTPIGLLIRNKDQRSKDYGEIANQFRPGHADYTYQMKYGNRDYRGGGRSSARETAVRVAAGAIADMFLKKILGSDFQIRGAVVQIGPHAIDRTNMDWDERHNNPFFCPDAAMMSINAAKGVEIGGGFALSSIDGSLASDEMRAGNSLETPTFLSNQAGGVLGGISTGQQIVVRVAIKPTSSILTPRQSIDRNNENVDVVTKGRHDPCVGIRGVPVAEAMMSLVLADLLMRHKAQCGFDLS